VYNIHDTISASTFGDIADLHIADLGCGCGVLSIGKPYIFLHKSSAGNGF
jgi:predicted RNA methylase